MSMYALDTLRDKLCEELVDIAKKSELGAGDLDILHKLTATIKNIDKISMFEDDDGYSRTGEWEAGMRGTYGKGSSYANRGKHYVRGHYSRSDGKARMRERLEDMMRDADDDRTREAIRRCMDELG